MEKCLEFKDIFDGFENEKEYIKYLDTVFIKQFRSNEANSIKGLEYAMKKTKQKKYETAYQWCNLCVGWYYHDNSEYDKALEYYTLAHEYFLENNMIKGLTRTSNALMCNYINLGMLDLGIEHGLKGIELSERINDIEYLVPLTINLAGTYLTMKYYKECKELIKRFNTMNCQVSYSHKIIIFSTLAECELELGNVEKSYKYCENSIELIRMDAEYKFYLGTILYIRAIVNYKMGKYAESEKDFEEAVKDSINYNKINLYISILIAWAKCDSDLGNYSVAKEKLLRASEECNKINFPSLMKEIYMELSVLYEKMGNLQEALELLKKSMEYERSIYSSKSSIWMGRLNSKKVIDDAKVYKLLYNQIEIITDIGKKITANLKKDETLESIYCEVNNLIEADGFGIALYKENEKCLDYEFFIEKGKRENLGYISIDSEASLGVYSFNNKKDIIINDISNEYSKYITCKPYLDKDSDGINNSLIFCPLIINDNVIGVVNVQNREKNSYTVNDLSALKMLSSYIAIALENSKLFNEVEHFAMYDNLTQVLNRREIIKTGEVNWDRMIENGNGLGVVMLDLDCFKQINDTYGHAVGDYVLKTVADVIKTQLSDNDIVGRYGGEEFLIILPNTNIYELRVVVEKIRKSIEEYKYQVYDIETINITASLGTYIVVDKDVSFFEGTKFADKALYKAKELGRNRVVDYNTYFKSM
ncbi:MAG: GGDEF domain-containing protein [Clostridium sp.]|uniref:sensor domain-containing diguanylate cyclase n=1 Tax=Clostridium sp. TaxID=1506 RepID=UPI00306AF376